MVFDYKQTFRPLVISSEFAARRARLAERRREARYPTQDTAEVEVRHGEIVRLPATVVDISRSGLCLKLTTQVGRGELVKISLPRQVVIFGEVRYCRRADNFYHAGVLIHEVFYDQPVPDLHISDEELSFYLVGKGLAVSDIIRLREHLIVCGACRTRLGATDSVLNPTRRRKT